MRAPAFTNSSAYRPGSTIIRCASIGNRVAREIALTTGKPTVMLGTNRPSITSTCKSDAPAFSTSAISSPSLLKFAERIDGAISIIKSRCQGVGATRGGRLGLGVLTPPFVLARGVDEALGFVFRGAAVFVFTSKVPVLLARFALRLACRLAFVFAFLLLFDSFV